MINAHKRLRRPREADPTPSAAAELCSPDTGEWRARLERLPAQMAQSQNRRLLQFMQRRDFLAKRLDQLHPGRRLEQLMQRLDEFEQRLLRGTERALEKKTHALALLSGVLDRLSPLKTLERGYAIASLSSGHVVTDATTMRLGDKLALRLHRGDLDCEVTGIHPESK